MGGELVLCSSCSCSKSSKEIKETDHPPSSYSGKTPNFGAVFDINKKKKKQSGEERFPLPTYRKTPHCTVNVQYSHHLLRTTEYGSTR